MVQKHGKAYLAHLQVHKSSVFKHPALPLTQTHVVGPERRTLQNVQQLNPIP